MELKTRIDEALAFSLRAWQPRYVSASSLSFEGEFYDVKNTVPNVFLIKSKDSEDGIKQKNRHEPPFEDLSKRLFF